MEQLRLWAVTQRSPMYQTGFAAIAIVLAVGLRHYLDAALPPGFPYLTFFPAVMLTGYFAGTRAGVVVAVVCGLAAWYWFLGPVPGFALTGQTVLALGFYGFIATTDLVLIHAMRFALTRLEQEKTRSDTLARANKTMFHELQHRVANNIQVVSSLLKMQRRNLSDEAARAALDAASARLQVVASIQRQLHNPKRQTTDLGHLLRDLLPEVASLSTLGRSVDLGFDIQPLVVSADQATPVALIAVELVSNAIEHATRDTGVTQLRLTIRQDGPLGRVIVQDDGKGLPPDFLAEKSRSLGLRVALQFAEQLGGQLDFVSDGGTRVTLTFPLETGAAAAP